MSCFGIPTAAVDTLVFKIYAKFVFKFAIGASATVTAAKQSRKHGFFSARGRQERLLGAAMGLGWAPMPRWRAALERDCFKKSQESGRFLKKSSAKNFCSPVETARRLRSKSFLVLFFKKEHAFF